ncbi:hypothetical protein SNOG_06009 [Parastagonospora nodorum SN15]|uniref:Uncharacterized protein n=1 Tax=Phaeosphaeria nodorum (strain SN15 / ATCC MYA-4574 / FGSC 10173) TaxID=321614 RepID=Q0UQF5_PHANO|nr:hypothetical protein SNOG_06009 [Parastagonospora nodorum SN15]EAT87073.1 hypothetical protein SNOG_06009 [Parastagonospora nodorum SN15]
MRQFVDECSATRCGPWRAITVSRPRLLRIAKHANLGDLNPAIGHLQRPEYHTEPGAGPYIAKPYDPGF